MKYLIFLLLAGAMVSCTTNSNQIVVPVNNFTITLNGHTYSENSDVSHPIVASVAVGKDLFYGNSISLASITVNSKNIETGWVGQNTNTNTGTGVRYVGVRDIKDSTECPYVLLDKGAGYVWYFLDTFSTFTITEFDAHKITGTFSLNLRLFPTDTVVYPATGTITYNLYYGSH